MRLLAGAALLGLGLMASQAATLIDLDATGQPLGTLDPWPNTGTLSGDFNAAASTFAFTPGEVITVDGVNGVAIRNTESGLRGVAYEGPISPESICGGASRTIEAWVWDPVLVGEKTVVSWGHRGGGPDGSNCTFGHGTHGTWGVLGGWGFADMGPGTNTPVAKRWTYIVYTYDSATRTARTYQDGVLGSTEVYATTPLVTWTNDVNSGPIPFRVARQTDANGNASTTGLGTNVIAKVRVRDVALTGAEVQAQFDAEKAQFGVMDSDGDTLPDWYEKRHGLNDALSDADADTDTDGLTNLQEYQKGTRPNDSDTDDDGLKDGVETGTGVWGSAANTGTSPFNPDADGDGAKDGVESNTGVYVSVSNAGTDPFKADGDGDGWTDGTELRFGANPLLATSTPSAASWQAAVSASQPKYWYRFEETDPSQPAANSGSATEFQGAYGSGIEPANLGVTSALPSLGTCIEFTGPTNGSATTKFVHMTAVNPGLDQIPELVNYRVPDVDFDKTTTVEYWFKTTQRGSHGANSWQSPAIMAHESPGDGDMYWGKINSAGEFGFSTSDNNDILTQRDLGKNCTDGNWHHLVMIKEWHAGSSNVSRMYLDGGPLQPNGAAFTKYLPAGNANYQDIDTSAIRYLGFVEAGELENVQYIGFLDEVAIYDRALTASEVRLHSQAVFGADTDKDGMPDVYEINNSLNANNPADAAQDADSDGSPNLQEYQRQTGLRDPDTDDDGVLDGAESDTGIWVSASNRGTDPFDADTDDDGLLDGEESNTGSFVSAGNTGTNPLLRDTDSDTYNDFDEVTLGFNPNDVNSHPTVPANYAAAVQANNPIHWLRFEETTKASGAANLGSAATGYTVVFGEGILDADLGKVGAFPDLGKALEFTGPQASNSTTKYVDFGAPIPELINLRVDEFAAPIDMVEGKEATVEYWIKTTQRGTDGNNTWRSPAILAHESGGDGDMYWGNINADGDFVFSTSDLHDCHITNGYATDGQWHHVVMSKIWHTNSPCISRLFVDGGADIGGKTILATTAAGTLSGQDFDSQIQYIGFTQSGEWGNVQYVGQLDEVAIYTNAFVEAQARLHYVAARNSAPADVTLQHQVINQQLILTWPQGTLQSADAVTGAWVPLGSARSPYTNSLTGNPKFFRVLVK